MTLSLRQRRRREAELEISTAALTLFEQQGVQATSVEQIAGAVEVSARTVFRYFAHKEDTALVAHTELRRVLRAAIYDTGMDKRLTAMNAIAAYTANCGYATRREYRFAPWQSAIMPTSRR